MSHILTSEKAGHVFKLRDIVLAVAAFSLQNLQHVAVLATRVRRIQTAQVAIHGGPEKHKEKTKTSFSHIRVNSIAHTGAVMRSGWPIPDHCLISLHHHLEQRRRLHRARGHVTPIFTDVWARGHRE